MLLLYLSRLPTGFRTQTWFPLILLPNYACSITVNDTVDGNWLRILQFHLRNLFDCYEYTVSMYVVLISCPPSLPPLLSLTLFGESNGLTNVSESKIESSPFITSLNIGGAVVVWCGVAPGASQSGGAIRFFFSETWKTLTGRRAAQARWLCNRWWWRRRRTNLAPYALWQNSSFQSELCKNRHTVKKI